MTATFLHMGFPTEDDCRRAARILLQAGVPFHLLSDSDEDASMDVSWLYDEESQNGIRPGKISALTAEEIQMLHDHQWVLNNPEIRSQYRGQFVAIYHSELLGAGKDSKQALENARHHDQFPHDAPEQVTVVPIVADQLVPSARTTVIPGLMDREGYQPSHNSHDGFFPVRLSANKNAEQLYSAVAPTMKYALSHRSQSSL